MQPNVIIFRTLEIRLFENNNYRSSNGKKCAWRDMPIMMHG
jgi:hypothetical protein